MIAAPHAALKKSPLLVEIRDLSKHFGGVAAVNHLSFDIQPGRLTGILGPNGARKSTTLRALLGLVQPSSGAATLGGLRYDELDEPSRGQHRRGGTLVAADDRRTASCRKR